MSQRAKQHDESLINYYEEHLLTRADSVYRFAFALTLSLDGAWQCVQKTYRNVADGLEKLNVGPGTNAASVLVSECWRTFGAMKDQKFAAGQSAVTKALKPLAVESRAALVAVDVIGLSPVDAAKAFGWDENELRKQLAGARRSLMMSTLDV